VGTQATPTDEAVSGIEGRSCVMDTPTERFGQMLEQIWHQDEQRTDEGEFRKALERIWLKKT
jgi:hypothetical protein